MVIHVDILGVPMLSDALGGKHLEVEISGTGIPDLVEAVAALGGKPAREVLFTADGGYENTIQLAVNGQRFVSLADRETRLEDGDRVTFLMLIGGG